MLFTAIRSPGSYYADLNPDYPSGHARRWIVWASDGPATGGPLRSIIYQYATRRAAERCAARLNEQDRRDAALLNEQDRRDAEGCP